MNILTLVSPGEVIYKVSLLLILIGTVIGAFSSVKAVRKYLTI